jgi:hypothetical protein
VDAWASSCRIQVVLPAPQGPATTVIIGLRSDNDNHYHILRKVFDQLQ